MCVSTGKEADLMDGQTFDKLVKNLSIATSRRGMLKGSLAALAALGTRSASAANKVTICHFTGSATNPYNIITISTNALNQHVANHGDFIYTDCCLDSECGALTDQCNVGACNAGTCVAVPQTGVACDDGDLCTTADTCDATGACVGTLVDCSALDDQCLVGTCDPSDGSCLASPANEGGPCDDGNACTSPDTCSGGVCAGPPISCDDGDPCTEDSCDPGSGCINEPIVCPEGQACLDGACHGCLGTDCSGIVFGCEDDAECNCFITVEGVGICHRSQLCAGLQSCTSSADCPTNWACSLSTCCGPEQGRICIRPCHEDGFAAESIDADAGGPTTTGG
jgi:hypothetical protein